jgi:hypothetical protein
MRVLPNGRLDKWNVCVFRDIGIGKEKLEGLILFSQ